MTAALALLDELRRRGAIVRARGDRLVVDAPKGAVPRELQQTLAAHKAELLALVATSAVTAKPAPFDPDAGKLVAFKLVNTAIGDVWVVTDDDTLADHPEILRSDLPVFCFDELERLRGKTVEELRAIAMVKVTFPTGRLLQ